MSDMSSPSLPTLPLSVFSHVMSFAMYRYSQAIIPSARSHPRKYLKNVALVSKNWLQISKQLMVQFEQETMEIQLENGTLDGIAQAMREISTRGTAVRDLRVRIGQQQEKSYNYKTFSVLSEEMEQLQVDWSAMLAKMPGLRRLDLKLVPLQSKHLPELLKAAGDHCAQLESLVLPRKPELKEVMQGEQIETVLKTLYATMEQIYAKGNRVGLKQLTVPTRNDAERHRSSTEFLDNVAKFCPNVEYLDGTDQVFHGYNSVGCEDKWMVPLNTWEQFTKSCTKLREFGWTPVPFADPFFLAFGRTLKPQLETMVVTTNLIWSWKEYHRGCGDETTAAIKDCHGRHAKNVHFVLAGCPALKDLTVEIDLQRYTDSPVRHFSIDIYGDEFSASMARNCPLLERFVISSSSSFEITTVTPIGTFTDASLLSLAELKYLDSVEINTAVMCTGNGIIDYIRRVLALNYYTGKSRELQIHIGGLQHGHFGVPTFYSAVVDMLRCLSEISEEDFGAERNEQKFEVFVGNPYHSRVSKQWSSKYMQEELKPLMKRMDMFSMSWLPKDKGQPMFWETEEDEDYTEHDICDHPPELMNVYYEVLGINPQDEERVARDVDFEDYVERDVWRY